MNNAVSIPSLKFRSRKVATIYAKLKAWERQGVQAVALRPVQTPTEEVFTVEYWPWSHLGQPREDLIWIRPDPRYRCGRLPYERERNDAS